MKDDRTNNRNTPRSQQACQAWREPITRMLDGELAGEERKALDRHLASCPACRAELAHREALRDDWASSLSLQSRPEERRAIVEAARKHLREIDARREEAGVWGRLPLLRRLLSLKVADLVTGAAVVAMIVLGTQLAAALRSADPTSSWAKSTPAVYYPGDEGRARDTGSELPFAGPQNIPRPF